MPAKKTVTEEVTETSSKPAKKTATKKTAAKKAEETAPAKKAAAKKTTAKKAAAAVEEEKTAVKKSTCKRTTAKKAEEKAEEKPAAKKTTAKKAAEKKTAEKKAPAKKRTTKKAEPKPEVVKKSVKDYEDIINWKKGEAHAMDWLYIEINAGDLLTEVEAGVDNLAATCQAILNCMLEGDGFIVDPSEENKVSDTLTVRYYCDNLSETRRKYFEV